MNYADIFQFQLDLLQRALFAENQGKLLKEENAKLKAENENLKKPIEFKEDK